MLELYSNIKKRREELGMSQSELAKRTGYTDRSSIAKIESGKVDLPQSKILEIASALKISASELMGWDDSDNVHGSEEGEFRVGDLEPIELELISKIRMLPKGKQLFVMSFVDEILAELYAEIGASLGGVEK